MAYGNYGAFVYRNGERRRDKEDVGVYDTDEAHLPSGLRIYANLAKLDGRSSEWWEHSHHGVMGDGPIRVGLYKQGFPEFYVLPGGCDRPLAVKDEDIVMANGWEDEQFAMSYGGDIFIGGTYDLREFTVPGCDGYTFSASRDEYKTTSWAQMVEPDGTVWECRYGYCYGAGFEDGEW